MSEPISLSLQLPGGIWQRVREVRSRVAEVAAQLPVDVRDAAPMAAAELVENAIKYGESVPNCPDINVLVSITAERITIEVSNGASDRAALDELFQRVQQISQSDDRESLYIGRLTEMLSTPGAGGKLGLYRIGFEGNFDLECHHADQILTVRATRTLS